MQEGGKDEIFLWQLEGSAEVSCGRGSGTLSQHCCTLIQAGEKSVSSIIFCLCDCDYFTIGLRLSVSLALWEFPSPPTQWLTRASNISVLSPDSYISV